MRNEPGPGDPLLRAVADCRAELDRLIDEQVEWLSRLGPAPAPRTSLASNWRGPDGGRSAVSAPTLVSTSVAVSGPGPTPEPVAYKPEPRPKRGARSVLAAPTPAPALTVEPSGSASMESPLRRLDALAKRLDGQRRRAGDRAPVESEAVGGPSGRTTHDHGH